MTVFSDIFEECQVVLDLSTSLSFKQKKAIKETITKNGGVISYIITKKTTHVVLNTADQLGSYKCKQARKLDIPIVSVQFLEECVQQGELLKVKPYLLEKSVTSQQFEKGKISVGKSDDRQKKGKKRSTFNPSHTAACQPEDPRILTWPTLYEVAKWRVLKKEDNRKGDVEYVVIEVHVASELTRDREVYPYRVALHKAWQSQLQNGEEGDEEFRFLKTADEASAVFTHLYDRYHTSHKMRQHHGKLPAGLHMGSHKFLELQSEMISSVDELGQPVATLVEGIWQEALGTVEDILTASITSIKVEQIDKAEGVLLRIRKALEKGSDADYIKELSDDFYTHLPHGKAHKTAITSVKHIAAKQNLCQLLRDVVSVGESTNWSSTSSPVAKFCALHCQIDWLPPHNSNYRRIQKTIAISQGSNVVKIENVFSVNRSIEHAQYKEEVGNEELLFHASPSHNFVGILSRGLLLPRIVVDDFGGKRSDPGMLGNGIYFADAASTSIKYSSPGKVTGSRLMLVSKVALGNCWDTTVKDTELKAPPRGYQSVHGTKATDTCPSEFEDDEYVIYDQCQQCLQYLVEFTLPEDTIQEVTYSTLEQPELAFLQTHTSVNDVKDIPDPLGKVEAGLRGDNDSPVPLKSVHIRAKLVDLAAQVVVLQEYNNENNVPIEAKYVFPLDDMAAVCGFEAFINGKHIIGEVKEKEEAHREYKEAISKGHGAYLMDEEKPDVFTVSVGNLPPKASVLIKITYVAELMTDGELIQFSLPGTVAPWEKDPHLSQVTQSDVDVVKVTQDGTSGSTSVQISIDMPFDIRSIHSPSHDIKMKKTATRAVVELPKNASLGEGLQLQIGLAEIHVPRMWVEKHPTKNSQACMLTFYPEFESSVNDEVEVLFLLDMSNSMKGSAAENAKKVLLLALELMPDFYKFNIIVFGTSYQELFTQARLRTSPNVEEARTFVMSQCPNLGNTDMWRVLHAQHLLPPSEGMRNIFLISDGHISSEDGTLRDVGKHFSHSRVFTLGIGTVANQHLLRGLARVGCGSYEYFDSSTKSKWQRKVETQLEQARQPSLTCVNVEWHQHGDVHARPPTQAPARITSLFSGTRQVVYGFVDNCTQATLKAEIEGEEISTMVSTHELQITTDKIVNTLTARAIIRDWEHGLLDEDRAHQELLKQTKKDWIIELSKEFSIVTKFTSFVAIEERNKDEEKQDGPGIDELVSKENVDSLNYMGWQVAPPEEEAVEVKAVRLLREAELAERISVLQAERHYEQLLALQEHLQDQKLKDIRIDVGKKLATFYKDVKQDNQQAEDIKKAFKVGHTVFIKTLTGKSLPAEVDGSMTVAQLKKQIKEMEGIPLDQQRLVFAGVQLQDQDNLQDYNLQSESTIHLVMRLRGGPIKEAISRQQDEREKAMDLMKQNIEKVLKRNEILETLDQKCDSLEQGSEYFYKLARKHRLSPVDAEHLLPRLKEREELLNKKVDFLERKIEEEVEMARRNKGNKNVALHALKKKRRFESQLMKVDSSLTKIEAASQEIIEDIDPDAELSDEISIMKDLSCMIEDGDEEQEMEDLEISMAISKPVDDFETEDDLLAELDDLTSEESLFDESEILSIEENVCEASAPASISFYPQRFGGAYDAPPATQAMFGGAYDAPPATQAMFGGAYGAPPAPSAMMHAMSAPGREAPPPPSAMPARSAPGRGAPPPPSVITATSAPGRGAPPPPSVITATSAPGRGAPPPPSAMPVRSAPVGVAPPPPSAITARSAPGRDAPPPPSAMPARSAPGGEAPPPPPPMPVRRGQLCRKMGDNALAQPLPAPIMSCASLIHEISYERPMMKKKRNSRGASSGSVEVADCMEELAMRGSASIMRRKTLEKEEEEDDESDDDDSMGFGLFGDEKYFLEEEKEKKDVKRVTGFMGRKKKKASSVVMDLEVKSSTFYASQESKIHSKKTKAKESIKPEPTNIWKKVFRVDTISLNTLMKVVDLCAGRWDSNIMTQVPELGINKLQLEMILINAGVKSLGNTAYKELLDLTLTLLMVMLLEKYTELAKNKKDQNYLKTQEMLSNIKSHLRNMENRYGSWYTRLELARSQDSLHTAIKEGLPHIDKSD